MNRSLKIAASLALVLGLGFPAYAGYSVWQADSKLTEARQEIESTREGFQGWSDTLSSARKELGESEARARVLTKAVEARGKFDSSLEAAKEQLQLAAGSIPIEPFQARILAAQDGLTAAGSNAILIDEQTAELDAVTVELKAQLGPVDSATKADAALSRAVGAALDAVGEALS